MIGYGSWAGDRFFEKLKSRQKSGESGMTCRQEWEEAKILMALIILAFACLC